MKKSHTRKSSGRSCWGNVLLVKHAGRREKLISCLVSPHLFAFNFYFPRLRGNLEPQKTAHQENLGERRKIEINLTWEGARARTRDSTTDPFHLRFSSEHNEEKEQEVNPYTQSGSRESRKTWMEKQWSRKKENSSGDGEKDASRLINKS